MWQPSPLTSWQWQLSGNLNTGYDVQVYDIDLFDNSTSAIEGLRARSINVICYFSAGSYEEWRDDADNFAAQDLGNNLDGWPGERWLDIRSVNVRSIMQARLDLAVTKGCVAVEPDNVDGYTNNPGFPLTSSDQLDYNRFLASEAHKRGLSIGLKNDLDQVNDLVDNFDFSVNEQCFENKECGSLKPFIDNNKAVFNAEYKSTWKNDADARADLCNEAVNMQISTLVLPLELDDSFRYSCVD